MFKTGKKPAVFHPTARTAEHFLTVLSQPIPAEADWSAAMRIVPILLNDKIGCCGIATSLHADQLWTGNAGALVMPDDASCESDYIDMTGYDPATGANDTGVDLLAKNQHWMNTGFAIETYSSLNKLDGFAQIQAGDLDSLRKSIAFFGCAELGVALPGNALQEYSAGTGWLDTSLPPDPNEGHDVLLVGYDTNAHTFKIATWDGFITASEAWVSKYMDEGTLLLRRTWLKADGQAPSGLSWIELDQIITAANGEFGPSALPLS
jgi:hypothetical protein